MRAAGSSSPLLLSLLLLPFLLDVCLPFSLSNCTISYSRANASGVVVDCSTRSLAVIPDDVPGNATSLDLSNNGLESISQPDLRGLSALKDARFSTNRIRHVDDGAFADLGELRNLNMNDNELTELTDDMFQGLTGLEALVLNENQISSISSGAFHHLLGVRLIDLGSNRLRQISDVIPAFQPPALERLQLQFNGLESLELEDLAVGSSSLTSLDLSVNPLTKFSLKGDVFPRLQELSLDECLDDMEWDVANKTFLRSLDWLSLSGTSISFPTYIDMLQTVDTIQTLALTGMPDWIRYDLVTVACQSSALNSLVLTGNDLGVLDGRLLLSCSGLAQLNLFMNQLTVVTEDAFRATPWLRVLLLNNNVLSEVPAALQALPSLEDLDLSFNLIAQLRCADFQNLTRLVSVDLQHNRISSLQACVFRNLERLKRLCIGQNNLLNVGDGFKVPLWNLESLDLNNNDITDLRQGDFRNLSSLRDLNLESDENYRPAEGAFQGLDSLRNLNVTLAFLDSEVFVGLPSLESLNIHLSYISSDTTLQTTDQPPFANLSKLTDLTIKVYGRQQVKISPDLLIGLTSLRHFWTEMFFTGSLHPDTFKYNPQLRRLGILRSSLLELSPELFWPIAHLEELDLSNNELASLAFLSEAKLSALSFLNLRENKLSLINETAVRSLPVLTYLDLSDNPLTCECSNSGFIRWAKSNGRVQAANGHRYTCAFPVSQRGFRFLDFDVRPCWADMSFLCFVCTAGLIASLLLSSFIHHFLRFHLAYAYYLFLAFLYDNRRGRKDGGPCRYDAFISYNVGDEAWVYGELVPELEGRQGWRLCLHHRDFEPGKPIVENITDAIYNSRKTICVISRDYLQSEWCSREIQMASFRLFNEHRDVLILLFVEEIPAHRLTMYHRMRGLLKRRSYLSWTRAAPHAAVFWENVRRALGADQTTEDREDLLVF